MTVHWFLNFAVGDPSKPAWRRFGNFKGRRACSTTLDGALIGLVCMPGLPVAELRRKDDVTPGQERCGVKV
jgi:hypothetical protein